MRRLYVLRLAGVTTVAVFAFAVTAQLAVCDDGNDSLLVDDLLAFPEEDAAPVTASAEVETEAAVAVEDEGFLDFGADESSTVESADGDEAVAGAEAVGDDAFLSAEPLAMDEAQPEADADAIAFEEEAPAVESVAADEFLIEEPAAVVEAPMVEASEPVVEAPAMDWGDEAPAAEASEPVAEPVVEAPTRDVVAEELKLGVESLPEDLVIEEPVKPMSEPLPVKAPRVAPPSVVQPMAPSAAPSDVAGLRDALYRKDVELAQTKVENKRLKNLVREIWAANKREKLTMYYNLGCIYKASSLSKKAEAAFLAALKVDPLDAGVHYNLAILYDDDMKDKKKAKIHYEAFLELAPNDKDAPRVHEWLDSIL